MNSAGAFCERGTRLPRDFFEADTREVARALLGKRLCHRLDDGSLRSARIVETEAYHGFEDRASHAHRGPTPRNQVMFGPPGHAYVYLCYGIHHLLNFVTGETGFPAAVLIRGVDMPLGFEEHGIGPGRLTKAMGISRRHDGADLCSCASVLWLEDAPAPPEKVRTSPRIGVDYAGEWARRPWRYYLAGVDYRAPRSGARRSR
ncbi:MAG: DNA-3-methyladenine glycosylase [Myxococcota bacterium]